MWGCIKPNKLVQSFFFINIHIKIHKFHTYTFPLIATIQKMGGGIQFELKQNPQKIYLF